MGSSLTSRRCCFCGSQAFRTPRAVVETHSSILAWRIPRTEQSGGLQSIQSQRVGHDCLDLADMHHVVGSGREVPDLFDVSGGVSTLSTATQLFWSSFTVKSAEPQCRVVHGPDEMAQSVCSWRPCLDSLWYSLQFQRFAGKNFSSSIIIIVFCECVSLCTFPCF